MKFVFYYKDKVRSTSEKENALTMFKGGGFYKAVCYFENEHPACFRIIETEEDIMSL